MAASDRCLLNTNRGPGMFSGTWRAGDQLWKGHFRGHPGKSQLHESWDSLVHTASGIHDPTILSLGAGRKRNHRAFVTSWCYRWGAGVQGSQSVWPAKGSLYPSSQAPRLRIFLPRQSCPNFQPSLSFLHCFYHLHYAISLLQFIFKSVHLSFMFVSVMASFILV